MCLAIYKPANTVVPEEYLKEGFTSNPHGAGFCFHDGATLFYVKGLMNYASFLLTYQKYVTSETAALIHFRWATLGPKDEAHTHPFLLTDGSCLIHNGPQISNLGDKQRSDTREFAEDILGNMEFDDLSKHKNLLEGYLEYNKVVVMSVAGEVTILNEDGGVWEDGIWYSNHGYLPYIARYTAPTTAATTARTSTLDLAGMDYDDDRWDAPDEVAKARDRYLEILDSLHYSSEQYGQIQDNLLAEDFVYDYGVYFYYDLSTGDYVEPETMLPYDTYGDLLHSPATKDSAAAPASVTQLALTFEEQELDYNIYRKAG